MGCVELYKRGHYLLRNDFANEDLDRLAAATCNLASGSSQPETNKFDSIRARSAEVYALEQELAARDEPYRELSVRTQRMALIDANIRHGFRPWSRGKRASAAVAAAWNECAWFAENGTLAKYGGQYPEELNPKQYVAFCYRFWQEHQTETG